MSNDVTKIDTTLPPVEADFKDLEFKTNIPFPTLSNARTALQKLGVNAWHDLFANKKYVGNMTLNSEVGGQLTDDAVAALRVIVREKFNFDPGKNNMWDAVNLLCRENGVHPVRDFLNQCFDEWQPDPLGMGPSIDTMLIDYFGAPDTPLIRTISRMVMVASCRRIFEPGAKFDYMVVLESPEGFDKSTALAELYGRQWFSDQTIIGLDDKQLAETLRGRWCNECADLSGMKKHDSDKVKAQLSRFEDRTRPAYGRAVIDAPRSNIFWGTTNDTEYLRSQTGNRRFLNVPCGRIDVERLKADRRILWGEAMAVHKTGESIMLPKEQWVAAGIEQDKRTMQEPWIAEVSNVAELARTYMERRAKDDEALRLGIVYHNDGAVERITSAYVLGKVIGIPPSHQTAEHGKRLGLAMRKHRWDGAKQLWIGGRNARGFERSLKVAAQGSEDDFSEAEMAAMAAGDL